MLYKSFGYVTGLKNNSFNAIKVFKTKVMRSQCNGKDNGKDNATMKYCQRVAGKRLTTGSLLNNLKLEEYSKCSHQRQRSVPKYKICSVNVRQSRELCA